MIRNQPTIRINIGRLALMPDATTDQALDFADYIADLLPNAVIKVTLNGRRHEVEAGAETAALAAKIGHCTAEWAAGERRLGRDNVLARAAGDNRALYRDTIPCPPPEGCQ